MGLLKQIRMKYGSDNVVLGIIAFGAAIALTGILALTMFWLFI